MATLPISLKENDVYLFYYIVPLISIPRRMVMGRSPSILKGSGDGMATPPFSLKGRWRWDGQPPFFRMGSGDGTAPSPFSLKGHDDGMGQSSILPYGIW